MTFIAGPYTATLGASTVGIQEEGYRIEHSVFKRLITGDNFAQTPQDAVFRGMEVLVSYRLEEYDAAGAATAFWPYGASYLTMGQVGRLDSNVASQLILTATAGTTAAGSPATVTLPLCILAEGFPVDLLFAPDLRVIPIRQRAYPNSSGVFGTLT